MLKRFDKRQACVPDMEAMVTIEVCGSHAQSCKLSTVGDDVDAVGLKQAEGEEKCSTRRDGNAKTALHHESASSA